MDSDADLLQAYVETRSEEAFAALVRWHLPLVYGAALRRVDRDVHRAEDVAQMVFTTLARKAPSLQRHPVLSGWLHTTCYHLSTRVMRDERLRAMREQSASETNATADPAVDWDRLRPVIDEALLELGEADRNAVLLRFFQSRPFSEIGHQLGLTENAARMRIERALDELHVALGRRGIRSTGSALGLALASESSALAAPGLATTIATNAVASAGGISPIGILFTMSKIKIAAAISVLIAGAFVVFNAGEQHAASRSIRTGLSAPVSNPPAIVEAPAPGEPAAPPPLPASPISALEPTVTPPAFAASAPTGAGRLNAVARLKQLYAPALTRFNLTDTQADIVGNALVEFSNANAEALNNSRMDGTRAANGAPAIDKQKYDAYLESARAAPTSAIKSVLGDDGYAALMAYRQSPEVTAVNQLMILESRLPGPEFAFSTPQRAQLLQLLTSAVTPAPPALAANQLDPDANRNVVTITPDTVTQASAFLSEDQLKILAAQIKPVGARAANPLAVGFSADK